MTHIKVQIHNSLRNFALDVEREHITPRDNCIRQRIVLDSLRLNRIH